MKFHGVKFQGQFHVNYSTNRFDKCTGNCSQLQGVAQWVGPDAAQPLTPRSDHLRSHLAYSPICPPRSSRSAEPPEEVGRRSRGSRGGWAPDRRGCPDSRASRPPGRRRALVAPHWRWPMMVVSWRVGARPHRLSLPIGNGCSDEVSSLAGAWRVTISMRP